jgi:hypothetical protein
MDNPPPQGAPVPDNADRAEHEAAQDPAPAEPTKAAAPSTEAAAAPSTTPQDEQAPATADAAPAPQEPQPADAEPDPAPANASATPESPPQESAPAEAGSGTTAAEPAPPKVPDDPDLTPPQGIPVGVPGHGPQQQQPWGQANTPQWDPVTAPFKKIRSNDPLAAAIGNASLLGVGYFLMRRSVIAILSIFLTAALLVLLATTWRTTWFEIVFLVWWVALIAHGWFLAGRRANKVKSRNQRIAAVAFAVPVILVVALIRWSGVAIDSDIDDARAAGDCAKAQDAIDGIWFGHNVVDAPMTVRGEQTTDACARLTTAKNQLTQGLSTGEPVNFDKGFLTLRGVLADRSGHENMVDSVLDGFLKSLPTPDACRTAQVTDWLRALAPGGDRLDRAKAVLPKVEPNALLTCGDHLLAGQQWEAARTRFEQLIEFYPGDPGVQHAKDADAKAGIGIEHDHVQELLASGSYCKSPAKYSVAPKYKKGTNRGYFIGDEAHVDDLPGGWKTVDFTKASIMVCLGEPRTGPVVRTCPYTYSGGIGTITVAFHKIAIPVKGYALQTGKKVVDATIQISGSSCPETFTYTSYAGGPPGDQDIKPTKAGVQEAFKFLVVR